MTSDANKPVSTAQAAAIALKADAAFPGWTAPTFQNSWTNFGGGYSNAGYYKDAFGRVYLRGLIKSGTIGAAAFTLPAGYRPPGDERFFVESNGGGSILVVDSSGSVSPSSGGNSYFSLAGVSFQTN